MSREQVALLAFNRGMISQRALARTDLKRTALSAETVTNWIPRVLGSMMLRPGFGHLGASHNNFAAKYLPFIFSTDDTALIEITDGILRVWIDDELVTRPAVSAAVSNGEFTTDLTGWTDNDETGAGSSWQTGWMSLLGNGTAAAVRDQQVAVTETGVEHALQIDVFRGPVILRVGSTLGDDDYISETTLETGIHSLAFTPTGDFHIRFLNRLDRPALVESCVVESSGVMALESPWLSSDLGNIRYDQSGDVIFVACLGRQHRRIERRAARSWSVVRYQTDNGPFRIQNTGPITITPSNIEGSINLVASAPLFSSGHAGSIWRITSNGQLVVELNVVAEDIFTNSIEVTGVDNERVFSVQISEDPAGSATFSLQRSLESSDGPWTTVATYTADTSIPFDDGLDNQIAWYQLGIDTGDYGSGSHTFLLSYPSGSIEGVVRITGVTNAIQATADVLIPLGSSSATDNWAEGEWSDHRGWPTAVAFVEGRLCWAGQNGVWLSESDDFHSFDDTVEGDSGPISRTIGSGPVDTINWIAALQRLILGAEGAEFSCKSSSLDEPLSPTNFNIKHVSTQGSAAVETWRVDKTAIYIQRGGTRVMELSYNGEDGEYGSTNLTQLIPEIGEPSIVRMSVQRQPDTRFHCVRSDGKVALAILDSVEEVLCWLLIETDGAIEDVVVLPGEDGDTEDKVYYHVRRTIDGSTVRYLEKWASETECVGGTLNKQADSFIEYDQDASSTITGLDHLEGEDVVVWDNGKCLRDEDGDIETFTVSSGSITVTNDGDAYLATNGIVGLPYTAQWKSAKLAYASRVGSSLAQKKVLRHLGVIMSNTHYQGLKYGPNFDSLDNLPRMKDGARIAEDTVFSAHDEPAFEFEGTWDTDARLCLQASAPRPCTLLAAVIPVEVHDKA